MKFSFRKIASVLTSAVMLGSTIGFAANFPEPFVKDGVADAAVVHGATATLDLAAATSIQQSLAAGVKTTVTTVEGENAKIEKSTDKLNFGETISQIKSSLSEENLPTLLAEKTYKNKLKEESDYTQKLYLGGLTWTHFEDDEDVNGIGSYIGDGVAVMNYSLEFDKAVKAGKTSAGKLANLKDTTITMLGKEYYILDADNSTKLTLLDAANRFIVTEQQPATVNVGGKTYTVSADIYQDRVKLTVNNEVTESLEKGETDKLSDGTYIGVKDIMYSSKESGVSKAEITIGSGKIVLSNGETVELNGEDVDGVNAYIYYSDSADELSKIIIEWTQDEEQWLREGDSLIMPGFESVKLILGKMNLAGKEKIEVKNEGENRIVLKAPIKDGDATIYLLERDSSGNYTKIGGQRNKKMKTSESRELILNTSDDEKVFIASWKSSTSTDAESYLLEITDVRERDGKNKTTIKNIVKTSQEWTKAEG
ncbi:MAG: hypothetical protein QXF25_02140, partial [Candidatus Pacearchaeota archaeon]